MARGRFCEAIRLPSPGSGQTTAELQQRETNGNAASLDITVKPVMAFGMMLPDQRDCEAHERVYSEIWSKRESSPDY
eukprot:gene644-361_t